jgi:uncharacterized protein (TIGR02118 family)
MIKTSLQYPNHENAHFDFDYYFDKHLPFIRECFGSALKQLTIDNGLSGGAPGSAPPFIVSAFMQFESIKAFQKAFEPHAQAIFADIRNFTDIQPVAMISETVLEQRFC